MQSPIPSNTREGHAQKHPATFRCSLCPRRYTRAFNLRNHLRTHTDERPFICSVCGKAFHRQHDRKTHEQLHSGEKKFICRGRLKDGRYWGCSRRFARASNLGRHFRSEVGRICIKPLREEELEERNAAAADDATRARRETDIQDLARPTSRQTNAERSAATTLTDTLWTLDTGAFSGVSPARPNLSQAAPPAPIYKTPARFYWSDWDGLWEGFETRSDTQVTRSGSVLDPHKRLQLLEKILKDKGFDVDAELNLELRRSGSLGVLIDEVRSGGS